MRNIELVVLFVVVWTPVFPVFVGMVPSVILVPVLRDMREQRRRIGLERATVVGRITILVVEVCISGYREG